MWNILVQFGAIQTQYGLSSTETLSVVMCDRLLNKSRNLYGDNYHSSTSFAEFLLTKKTYWKTIRTNRKNLSEEVKKAKLKKGELKAGENNKGVKFYATDEIRGMSSLFQMFLNM